VSITTNVVNSNLDQGEVYTFMWQSLSMIWDRSVVFPVPPVSSINKTLCDKVCQSLATESVVFSEYSNVRHKSSNWNICESSVQHVTSNINFLFISINEHNWFAESMLFNVPQKSIWIWLPCEYEKLNHIPQIWLIVPSIIFFMSSNQYFSYVHFLYFQK
jgi:hypothetical protein